MDSCGLPPSQPLELIRAVRAGHISFDALLAFPVDWDLVASSLAVKDGANVASVGPSSHSTASRAQEPTRAEGSDEVARRVRRQMSPESSVPSPTSKRPLNVEAIDGQARKRSQRTQSPVSNAPSPLQRGTPSTGMEAGLQGLEISSGSALGLRLSPNPNPTPAINTASLATARPRSSSAPQAQQHEGPLTSHWRWHEAWPSSDAFGGASASLPVIDELDPRSPALRDDDGATCTAVAPSFSSLAPPLSSQAPSTELPITTTEADDTSTKPDPAPRSTSVHWQGSWGLRKPKMRLSLSMLRPYFPSV